MAFVSNHGTIFPPSGYVGRVLWCLKKLPMSSEVILFSPDSRVFNKFIQVSAGFLHVKKVPARFWQCFKNVPTSFFHLSVSSCFTCLYNKVEPLKA